MKLRTLISLFLLLTLLFPAAAWAQSNREATARLMKWFRNAERFDYVYPREKVYLHLDNASYLEGDTIWYKAYVVRASSLRPTELSKVLYVDLLNADGQLVEKQTLRIDSLGQADGCFKLLLPIRAGYYELRAYTREMTNWDAAACYSRIVPVFTGEQPNAQQSRPTTSNLTELSIPEPMANDKITFGAPRPYEMKNAKHRLLTFYPEGGLRAKGLAQRVAFKLTDGRGRALDENVNIYSADGTLYDQVAPEYDGMGNVLLPADFSEGYATVGAEKRHFKLPQPEAAYTLQAVEDGDGLSIVVQATDSAARAGALLGLAVMNRELACYFDTLTAPAEPTELYIPNENLRTGVCRIELFDVQGRSLASRLVWVNAPKPSLRKVRVNVSQNEAVYDPFSPAVVKVQLTDAANRPVQTVVSVSVRDKASDITDPHDGGLYADLLLSSEVKGYVHRPDLYFEKDDAAHRRMLDLLLMVQGWTAQRWEVMTGCDTFALRQPIEDKLILRGRIFEDNNKMRPLANQSLSFQAYSLTGGAIEGDTRTDSEGRFAFESNVNYEGELVAQFVTRKDSGKRRWTRLTLDRWFAPQPQPLFAPQLELVQPTQPDSAKRQQQLQEPQTFEWKDTLSRTIPRLLGEAGITARGKYRGFTGNRYTWGGGERHGMQRATRYYNIEQFTEYIKDMGRSPLISLSGMLGYLEGEFSYDHDTYDPFYSTNFPEQGTEEELQAKRESEAERQQWESTDDEDQIAATHDNLYLDFKGHELKFYLNNDATMPMSDMTIEEIKSAYLVMDSYITDAVTGERKRMSSEQYKFYIYEIPDFYLYRTKKGIDKRRIQGFTAKTSFYAPDYRSFDLPSESDQRRTLHWLPSLRTDAEGKANFVFFTNSHAGQWLDISIRGITKDGSVIEYEQ